MSDWSGSPYTNDFATGSDGSTQRVCKRRKGVTFVSTRNEVVISPEEQGELAAFEALDERKRHMVDDRKEYKSDVRTVKVERNKMRTKKSTLESCAEELGKPCCNLGHMM